MNICVSVGQQKKAPLQNGKKNKKDSLRKYNTNQKHFEKQFGESMENYAGSEAAKTVTIPTLVIHDENDYEVLVNCSKNIHQNLSNATLEITKGLGHRKILGDKKVIEMSVNFVK